MPIFAYCHRACGSQFQTLVRSGETPTCEVCHCTDLGRQLPLIATPNKGGEPNTGMNSRGDEMGGCACGTSFCPALGLG
jgi:hypothetical protein